MPTIKFVQADGTTHQVNVPVGASLMQAAMENMVSGIEAECGGSGSCATCHCYLDKAWSDKIESPDDNEAQLLEMVIEPNEFSRLSCQVKVQEEHHGLIVRLPVSQY
ncbi:2Fe-2S iron-sulfur cluster-binding protein [Pseudoalteromonas fenneropenaei]|uniref:2Fe-2S iron-sulfur cluster-binding protein n=1 Tax=Pseudoalteromonas fenneropenaei TaxID=1737459 RepID=A0ABV7CJW1_9GAMM